MDNTSAERPLTEDEASSILRIRDRELTIGEGEIEVRKVELELSKQQDNNQLEYANKLLDANMRDREDTRVHDVKLQRIRMWFACVISVFILVFLGFLVFINEAQTAKDIITLSLTVVGVSFGGYYFGKSKGAD